MIQDILVRALSEIADSYAWDSFTGNECVVGRPGVPTNRRIARESLAKAGLGCPTLNRVTGARCSRPMRHTGKHCWAVSE